MFWQLFSENLGWTLETINQLTTKGSALRELEPELPCLTGAGKIDSLEKSSGFNIVLTAIIGVSQVDLPTVSYWMPRCLALCLASTVIHGFSHDNSMLGHQYRWNGPGLRHFTQLGHNGPPLYNQHLGLNKYQAGLSFWRNLWSYPNPSLGQYYDSRMKKVEALLKHLGRKATNDSRWNHINSTCTFSDPCYTPWTTINPIEPSLILDSSR